jgi:hypothetical protein
MEAVKRVDEIAEEPHPFLRGVTMKTLLSKRDNGADVTCIIVHCPKGSEIEEHNVDGGSGGIQVGVRNIRERSQG